MASRSNFDYIVRGMKRIHEMDDSEKDLFMKIVSSSMVIIENSEKIKKNREEMKIYQEKYEEEKKKSQLQLEILRGRIEENEKKMLDLKELKDTLVKLYAEAREAIMGGDFSGPRIKSFFEFVRAVKNKGFQRSII